MSDTKSLGEALPDEIKRVTEILGHYVELGPVGTFGAMMIRTDLDFVTRAIASGDVVAMLRAYEKLCMYCAIRKLATNCQSLRIPTHELPILFRSVVVFRLFRGRKKFEDPVGHMPSVGCTVHGLEKERGLHSGVKLVEPPHLPREFFQKVARSTDRESVIGDWSVEAAVGR